jgi:hypothetical protein
MRKQSTVLVKDVTVPTAEMAADTHFADGLATNYDNNSIIFLFTY